MKKQDLSQVTLVVLMAGNATRLAPLSYSLPKGLLSLGNRPSIDLMITPLIKQGIQKIVFVVNPQNEKLIKSFIARMYPGIKADFCIQERQLGPMDALRSCIPYLSKPVLLLYGDTLCGTDFDFSKSFIGTHQKTDNGDRRFCLVKCDTRGIITKFDYYPVKTGEQVKLVTGIYFFKNFKLLKSALNKTYPDFPGETQMHGLLDFYTKNEPVCAANSAGWFDSGSYDTYAKAIEKYSKTNRSMFKLTACGTIKKFNKEAHKESAFYNNAPPCLVPRIFNEKQGMLELEFYDSLTLGELFNFYPLRQNIKNEFLEKLNKCIKRLHTQKFPQNAAFSAEKSLKEYICNNFANNLNNNIIENIVKNSRKHLALVHGDLNFFNILFSPRTGGFKFIDPETDIPRFFDKRIDYAAIYASVNYPLLHILLNRPFNQIEISETSDCLNKILLHEKLDAEEIKILAYIYMYNLSKSVKNKEICRNLKIYALQGLQCTQKIN